MNKVLFILCPLFLFASCYKDEPLYKPVNTIYLTEPDTLIYFSASPNPFSEVTNIYFEVNRATFITYSIADINGRMIIENEIMQAFKGKNTFPVRLINLRQGIYFFMLNAFEKRYTVKLIKI